MPKIKPLMLLPPLVFLGLALLFVFLILAAQYESWSLPMGVLLGTPIAIFGAMAGLWISGLFLPGYQNNVFEQIGLVMLVGLAASVAIGFAVVLWSQEPDYRPLYNSLDGYDAGQVVELLQQGLPYRRIHELTGVSVTTIGRVARFATDGFGGYQLALDRTRK